MINSVKVPILSLSALPARELLGINWVTKALMSSPYILRKISNFQSVITQRSYLVNCTQSVRGSSLCNALSIFSTDVLADTMID